ncbi:TonB-dependent receptor [Compostibacter hankyongensis]|uniref:TonB-dependent receptor n=1 Tax=Compostibacter hankyongensis TaxID=1007089 RepID=A0ABP8FL74_9BACT
MYKNLTHLIRHIARTSLLLILILYEEPASAQQGRHIRGTVTAADGATPLTGVTVVIQGTQTGATTGADGTYAISGHVGDTLVFSYVGYAPRKVAVGALSGVNVALKEAETSLNQLVVMAYGTQKRATVTGAIATIGGDEIKTISTPDLVTGLAGKLPGLRVTQRNSEPGSYGTSFDIRGFGAPLVVIDGIVASGNDFVRLDPNDIADITVLKDASAAVYGIKAANGVVLVTTKKGGTGKPQITYSGSYEFQQVTNIPEVGNAYQFAVLTTENEINGGRAPGETTFSKEDIQKFKDGTYPSTDWYGAVARDYAPLQHHNLSVTGGNEHIRYFTALSMLNEKGLWKSGDLNYKKYGVRASVTGKITEDLEAQINMNGMLEEKNEPGETAWNIFKFVWMNIPTYGIYANDNPAYLQDMTYPWNPVAMSTASIGGYTRTKTKTFDGSFVLDYTVPFLKGLKAKAVYGFYSQDYYQRAWRKAYSTYDYDKSTDTYIPKGTQNSPSNLTENYTPYQRSSLTGQLTYERQFLKKHDIKASLVFEERHEKNDNMWAKKEFSIDVDQFFAGNAQNSQVNSGGLIENDNQNVIGKFNYDYLSRYLLEFGFNYGGSSKFPAGKRWGFFPYVSAGWRLSEEPFFKSALPLITNLKIRGSWGQMGDDNASTFQFLTGYDYPGGNYIFEDKVISGLGFRGMPNPYITWYTVTTKDLGIDLEINSGLITAQFDIFRRDRSGLLGTRLLTIPGTVGASLPQENLNADMRRGFELVLGHARRKGTFQYNISGNVTYTRGKLTSIERAPDGNSYLNWRNNPLNRWDNINWGYDYIGQFRSYDDIYSSPIQDGKGNTTLRPGDLKYKDVNKDGIIDDQDVVPIGRSYIPDINFGLNIAMTFRGFDLSIFFQGAANYNYEYIEQLRAPLPWGRNSLTQFMDRWHHEDIFDAGSPWIPGKFPATNYPPSDGLNSQFWRPSASYARLKSVELGYTFSPGMLKRAHIQHIRVYLSGFNLYTLTKLKYIDPEHDPGTYNYLYPITRNYDIGVSITL